MIMDVGPANFSSKKKQKKTFCGFSMRSDKYWVGMVYDMCVYYMMGFFFK